MKNIVFRIITNTIAILIAAWILSGGIHITNIATGIWVAVVLIALNSFIRPILMLISVPFTLFSFGLFIFAINAFIVMLASTLVKGFNVDSFGWALGFSILVPTFRFLLEIPEKLKNGSIKVNRTSKVQEADWEDITVDENNMEETSANEIEDVKYEDQENSEKDTENK